MRGPRPRMEKNKMANLSDEQVAKWRAEAERRKGLDYSVDAGWAYNRIIDLAISHYKLSNALAWLAAKRAKPATSEPGG